MKFNDEDLSLITRALNEREIQLTSFIREWTKATWDNIGGLQGLYANETAFKQYREQRLKEWKEELEEINKLQEKIEEMDD